MSERATPETDAVATIEGNWDTKALRMGHHARKLERERDEARDMVLELREALEAVRKQCDWDGRAVIDGAVAKAKEVLP